MKLLYIPLLCIVFLYSCKDSPTQQKQKSPEPDSTSNNFIWQIDTLGSQGSDFSDAWGTGPDNIYAVGFIYDPEPGNYGTCVMHWNGVKWSPMNLIAAMGTIYGFSDNDIWVGGSDGVVYNPHAVAYHWDGKTWSKYDIGFLYGIEKFWGTSSKNLYAVGGEGIIMKYDGTKWNSMASNTQQLLYDIWGTSDSDIYACGGNDDNGSGVLLHYDGKTWMTLYDQNTQSNGSNPVGYAKSLWGFSKDNYILSPWGGSFQGSVKKWTPIFPPKGNTFIEAIRGTSAKNYFLLGDFNLIIHWNGKSWKRFDQFYKQAYNDNLYSLLVFENEVFIFGATSGGIGYKAIVYHGKMVY